MKKWLLLFMVTGLFAGYSKVTTKKSFYDKISRGFDSITSQYKVAVASFKQKFKGLKKTDRDLYDSYRASSEMFKEVSGDQKYVRFIDVIMKDSELSNLKKELGISKVDPVYVLFKDGMVYKDKLDKPVVLSGWQVNRYQLNNVIENHFKTILDDIRKQKAEQEVLNSYYWGFGWGYPYYSGFGWGYPYYGWRRW